MSERLPKIGGLLGVALIATPSLFPVNAPASAAKRKVAPAWSLRWQPQRLVNGSPVLFQVTPASRLQTLSGKWLEHDVFFFFDPGSKSWFGLAGIGVEAHPGTYRLALEGKSAAGGTVSWQRSIAVRKALYRQIAVRVPRQFTEPSPEQLKQIKADQDLKRDVFAHMDAEREWSGRFLPPVDATTSDVFGTRRIFNGQTQSVHQGLDYEVPQGTPVEALNRGVVLLARPLFFEGNCVVLNHGQGLLTIYMHLSKIDVQEQEQVVRGQKLGLSGGTGRATGPHLHVAVRWQGMYLDPAALLGLRMP